MYRAVKNSGRIADMAVLYPYPALRKSAVNR